MKKEEVRNLIAKIDALSDTINQRSGIKEKIQLLKQREVYIEGLKDEAARRLA